MKFCTISGCSWEVVSVRKSLITRVAISLLIGLALGVLVNEATFAFLREDSRPPQTIELVIPIRASEQVARGEQPASIPASMGFVAGDTLVVYNQDVVAHQLGPLWIPAGGEASLKLDTAGRFSDECSFQSTNYFDLDVGQPLTPWIRLQGILMAGIPLGILLALYAAVAWPLKK